MLAMVANTISMGVDDGGASSDDIFCSGHLVGAKFAKYFTAQEFATVFLEGTSGLNLRRKIDIFCDGLKNHQPELTEYLLQIINEKLPPVEATAGSLLTYEIDDWRRLAEEATAKSYKVCGLPILLSVVELCRATPKNPKGEKDVYLTSLALDRAGIWKNEVCDPKALASSLSS